MFSGNTGHHNTGDHNTGDRDTDDSYDQLCADLIGFLDPEYQSPFLFADKSLFIVTLRTLNEKKSLDHVYQLFVDKYYSSYYANFLKHKDLSNNSPSSSSTTLLYNNIINDDKNSEDNVWIRNALYERLEKSTQRSNPDLTITRDSLVYLLDAHQAMICNTPNILDAIFYFEQVFHLLIYYRKYNSAAPVSPPISENVRNQRETIKTSGQLREDYFYNDCINRLTYALLKRSDGKTWSVFSAVYPFVLSFGNLIFATKSSQLPSSIYFPSSSLPSVPQKFAPLGSLPVSLPLSLSRWEPSRKLLSSFIKIALKEEQWLVLSQWIHLFGNQLQQQQQLGGVQRKESTLVKKIEKKSEPFEILDYQWFFFRYESDCIYGEDAQPPSFLNCYQDVDDRDISFLDFNNELRLVANHGNCPEYIRQLIHSTQTLQKNENKEI
eukprot:Awhi_evm1s966